MVKRVKKEEEGGEGYGKDEKKEEEVTRMNIKTQEVEYKDKICS